LHQISACIPDFKVVTIEDNSITGKMKLGIGPLKGNFEGKFLLTNIKPQESLNIEGNAKGMNGSVDILINVTFSEKILMKY